MFRKLGMFDRSLGMFQPNRFVSAIFSPSELFAAGEQGAWYDPSDFSTMFQENTGVTPVTAMEQPVGLLLDKSKNLTIGPEITTNGGFNSGTTGWTLTGTGATFTATGGVATITTGSTTTAIQQTLTTVVGATYQVNITRLGGTATAAVTKPRLNGVTLTAPLLATNTTKTFYFTSVIVGTTIGITCSGSAGDTTEIDEISVKLIAGNHAFQSTTTSRPILRNLYNMLICQTTMATQNVTTLATSYTLRFTGTGTVTLSGTATGTLSSGSNTFNATAGTLTLTVSGTVSSAMLTPTNEASLPFQSVTSNTPGTGVYDTNLNNFKPYLFFDGTDDWLQTGAINFSSTDAMSVFAGVRKLSTTLYGIIAELSASSSANSGTFLLQDNAAVAGDYGYGSSGTTLVTVVSTTFAPPVTSILTGLSDISADSVDLRVNGTSVGPSASDQGTGNYGAAYPLYVGRRAGTTFPLTGRIYSLIVRGALTSGTQLTNTEAWVNSKTGAY